MRKLPSMLYEITCNKGNSKKEIKFAVKNKAVANKEAARLKSVGYTNIKIHAVK